MRTLSALLLCSSLACAPKAPIPIEQIPQLETLKDVMHVQAKAADPQFKKMGGTFGDADWEGLKDTAARLQATAVRAKSFTEGANFDKYADELNTNAGELAKAADAKDSAATSKALEAVKGTCKACHKEFK